MSKYIDAEKIPWTDLNDGRGGVNVYVTFLEKVARMPAADVVEVVRCEDCDMWSDSFEVKDLGKLCMNFRIVTKPDFYCAWGSKE